MHDEEVYTADDQVLARGSFEAVIIDFFLHPSVVLLDTALGLALCKSSSTTMAPSPSVIQRPNPTLPPFGLNKSASVLNSLLHPGSMPISGLPSCAATSLSED